MGSHGIKDQVAIVGMGCTRFAEHWDKGADLLAVEAVNDAFVSAGVDKTSVDAYWLGTALSGASGMMLSKPLELSGQPVVRVENMCATGAESLRQAAYAVACGAYDVAAAVGVEKAKDSAIRVSTPSRSRTTVRPVRSRRPPCSPWRCRPTPTSTASTRRR